VEQKVNNRIIAWILFFFLALSATTSFLSFLYSYDSACNFIAALFHKEHQLALFKQSYLTGYRYRMLQLLLVFLTISLGVATYFCLKKYDLIVSGFGKFLVEVKELFKKSRSKDKPLERTVFLSVLSFFFAWSLYNIIHYPISYDEAWTYLNFSKRPLLAAFYYPAANNHIFFSLLTNISALFTIDHRIEIRIVSLLFGTLSVYFMYRFLRHYFSFPASIISTSLFAFSYPVALYTMLARGYILELFFFILSTYCVLQIIEKKDSRVHQLIFVITSVLAFYTLPSYLYAFTTQLLFAGTILLLTKNAAGLKYFFLPCLLIVIIVVLLYSPILLINGPGSIVSNINTKPISIAEINTGILPHLSSTSNWLFGIDHFGIYLVLALVVFLLYILVSKSKYKALALFSLLCILLPVFFIYAHKVIPFQRTWIHLTLALALCIALISETLLAVSQKARVLFILFALLLSVTSMFRFNLDHPVYHNNYAIDKKAGAFVRNKNFDTVHTIYNHTWNFPSDCFETFVVYKQQQDKKAVVLIDRKKFDPLKKYDLLILTNKDTVENNYLADYNLLYIDMQVKLYRRKP